MNEIFDVYTLIFLVAAVFIFLRLRSVLGRRTGNERPGFDPLARSDKDRKPGDNDDKAVPLPSRKGRTAAKPVLADIAEEEGDPWEGIAAPGSDLAGQLDNILKADRSFNGSEFLAGAQIAYEMIVTAFNEGDRRTLRPLLSPDVYDSFQSAIAEREDKGDIVESRFIGIDESAIQSARIRDDQAQLTVRFKSSLVSVTRDKDGTVVDGDAKTVVDVNDVWTFARALGARDPNWQLVSTEAD